MKYIVALVTLVTLALGCSPSRVTGGPVVDQEVTAPVAIEDTPRPSNATYAFYEQRRAEERAAGGGAVTALRMSPHEDASPLTAAACRRADGSWACTAIPKPPPVLAATAGYPVQPSSWTVSTWYLDPNNASGTASDNNSCTSSGAACLTWKEIYNGRWGCIGIAQPGCPAFPQSMTVNVLSTSPSNGESDPVGFCPSWRNGAQIQIVGALNATTQVSTGTITVTQALNRTSNPGTDLQITVSGSAITGGVTLIQNSTHASFSTYYQLAPSTNQPLNPTTTVGTPPAVVTWLSGDSYTAYVPAGLNIVKLCGQVTDTPTTPMIVNQLTFLSSEQAHVTGTFQVVEIDGPMIVADNIFNRKVLTTRGGGYYPATRFVDNMFNMNGQFQGLQPTSAAAKIVVNGNNGGGSAAYSTVVQIFGGSGYDQPETGELSFENVYIDDDFRSEKGGIGASFYGMNIIGTMEIEGSGGYISNYGYILMNSPAVGNTPIIWGDNSTTYYGQGQSRLSTNGGTAVNSLGPSVAPRLNARVATGCSHSNANNPDVINCGISLTQANIDAVQGTAGFGGLAFLPGGASISTSGQ